MTGSQNIPSARKLRLRFFFWAAILAAAGWEACTTTHFSSRAVTNCHENLIRSERRLRLGTEAHLPRAYANLGKSSPLARDVGRDNRLKKDATFH
jgi:hypothetical protein